MNADEILRRLVEWQDKDEMYDHLEFIINDARAYLAAREKVVWAEGWVKVEPCEEDSWTWRLGASRLWTRPELLKDDDDDGGGEWIYTKFPVPTHLLNPALIEGEVVEGE